MVYQDATFIQVFELLDLFDKEHERVIGLNDKFLALVAQLIISVRLARQEATRQSEIDGTGKIKEGFRKEGF